MKSRVGDKKLKLRVDFVPEKLNLNFHSSMLELTVFFEVSFPECLSSMLELRVNCEFSGK
jgi:hypothetical protein